MKKLTLLFVAFVVQAAVVSCTVSNCHPATYNCQDECPLGYSYDVNDCNTCNCCQPTTCPDSCSSGYNRTKLPDNCSQCTCSKCPPVLCPTVCKNGHPPLKGISSEGCHTCSCSDFIPTTCPKTYCPACLWGNEEIPDKERDGCTKCVCVPKERKCKPLVCPNHCPSEETRLVYGNYACEKCVCPKIQCSRPQCPSNCTGGTEFFLKGKQCERCRCVCELRSCKYCEYGYMMDEHGCQTCDCKTKECPVFKCKPCEHGYSKDKKGCETCECRTKDCPLYKCNACKYGYQKDENGCRTCKCINKDVVCPAPVCPKQCRHSRPTEFYIADSGCKKCRCICPMFKCRPCEYGYKKRKNGCQTCRCKASDEDNSDGSCVPVTCPKCRLHSQGTEHYTTTNGCKKCRCLCPLVKCVECKRGYKSDKYGCRTCQCKGKRNKKGGKGKHDKKRKNDKKHKKRRKSKHRQNRKLRQRPRHHS